MRISAVNNIIINRNIQKPNKQPASLNRYNSTELSGSFYYPVNFRGNPASEAANIWKTLSDLNFRKSINKIDEAAKEASINECFQQLDNIKNSFTADFCNETGFPNLNKVSEKMESAILNCANDLSKDIKADLLFVGYDKNCSLGRKLALPGSDCDGLFIVFDKNPVESLILKAGIPYTIDQRMINMPINHAPEVFNIDEIHNGFNIVNSAFEKLRKELRATDYENFEINILRNDNDFVRAGDFNIRLGKYIPQEQKIFISMMSYLAEYIRNGRILVNNLDNKTINLIKNSPLYQYGNITRQEGLSGVLKPKIKALQNLENDFNSKTPDEKYNLIKDILLSTLNKKVSASNEKYFKSAGNGTDMNTELGNIIEMYQQLFQAAIPI